MIVKNYQQHGPISSRPNAINMPEEKDGKRKRHASNLDSGHNTLMLQVSQLQQTPCNTIFHTATLNRLAVKIASEHKVF